MMHLMLHNYKIWNFNIIQCIMIVSFNSSFTKGLMGIFEQYVPKRHSVILIPLSMFLCHLFSYYLCFYWSILKAFIPIRNLSLISTIIYKCPLPMLHLISLFLWVFASSINLAKYFGLTIHSGKKTYLYNLIAFYWLWSDSQYMSCYRKQSHTLNVFRLKDTFLFGQW